MEFPDCRFGEGLARLGGSAGQFPCAAPVTAEKYTFGAADDHADSERGVGRREGTAAGSARHALRAAGRVQPVRDRVVRLWGVDRCDRLQDEAVLAEEVFPKLRREHPHVHGVVLGGAGQPQDLGSRGHLAGGAAAVGVGVQRREDQPAAGRWAP
ncbi:hypothetical protein GCM10009578_092600 [Streptomyces rhizosphaericus]